MLANVPRVITRSLPRREPNELKSLGSTPAARRNWPAGSAAGMAPAGEMWSVVTESPSSASTRAPAMGWIGAASTSRSLEEGRLLDVGRVVLPVVERRPSLVSMAFQRGFESSMPS